MKGIRFLMPLTVLLAAGCEQGSEQGLPLYTHEPLGTNQQVFQVQGVVVEVKPLEKSVTIKHQAIPGYMAAMTMPYTVKDDSLLDKLSPGDQITADVVVSGDSSWLENIVVTGHTAPPKQSSELLYL